MAGRPTLAAVNTGWLGWNSTIASVVGHLLPEGNGIVEGRQKCIFIKCVLSFFEFSKAQMLQLASPGDFKLSNKCCVHNCFGLIIRKIKLCNPYLLFANQPRKTVYNCLGLRPIYLELVMVEVTWVLCRG